MSVEVFCAGCGERGSIERVAARVIHSCGSDRVDLWLGTPEQLAKVAAKGGTEPVFINFMRIAKQPPMPPPQGHSPEYVGDDPVAGWDQFAGPTPQPSHMNAPAHTDVNGREPTKKQPGVVEDSNIYVYDKHRPHPGYGEGAPAPLVAEHEYPAPFVTKTPFLGQRKKACVRGIPLKGASCPRCGTADTAIVADDREHAHWYCSMRLCGSLVDLDRDPAVNPFRPEPRTWGEHDFWHGKRVSAAKKDGQLMTRMATVSRVNPGLSLSEVVYLARQSVIQYPEA